MRHRRIAVRLGSPDLLEQALGRLQIRATSIVNGVAGFGFRYDQNRNSMPKDAVKT